MKQVVNKIFSLLLVVIVLSATMQFSITKMTCLMTGKIVFSISDIEDCKPVKKGCNVDDVCCDFHKITFNHSIESFSSTFISYISPILFVTSSFREPKIVECFQCQIDVFNNLPPPLLSGIELLKAIQVFRL